MCHVVPLTAPNQITITSRCTSYFAFGDTCHTTPHISPQPLTLNRNSSAPFSSHVQSRYYSSSIPITFCEYSLFQIGTFWLRHTIMHCRRLSLSLIDFEFTLSVLRNDSFYAKAFEEGALSFLFYHFISFFHVIYFALFLCFVGDGALQTAKTLCAAA